MFVGMATRAYMEEAVLSAGLTFIPGAKLSASIEEALLLSTVTVRFSAMRWASLLTLILQLSAT